MNCSDIEKKWQQYLNGTLTGDEEEKIEAHIKNCKNCRSKLNDELKNENPLKGYPPPNSLKEEKETKILKWAKWKSRISNAVFLISVLLLVTLISGFLSAIYYSTGTPSRAESAVRVSKMITELTMPNVFPGSGGSNVKPFFGLDSSYELKKTIGRESYTIGHLKTNMLFNRMNVDRNWNNDSFDVKLFFVHPEEQKKGGGDTWGVLELLPTGTVSELAVSFDRNYSLSKVYDIFSGYDIELLWFPVDTGVELNSENGKISGPLSATGKLIGFPHFGRSLEYEPDKKGGYTLKVEGDSDKKEAAFIRALEFLVKHEDWAQKAYRGRGGELMLKERLDYVQENGVKVYGAVVTGPTKELLRLKEVEEIRFPVLGEVAWWNWQVRNYSGTIYN